nr:MAG TPA: hypothetical protein [Inoviridae sp.]
MIAGAWGTKGAPMRMAFMLQSLARVARLWQFLLDSSNITHYFVALKSKKWEM